MAGYVVTGICTIIVAIIEAIAARDRKAAKRRDVKIEERAKIRAEESRLSMEMMDANMDLSLASAEAIKSGGQWDGMLETAIGKSVQAQDKYRAYLQKIASGKIAEV